MSWKNTSSGLLVKKIRIAFFPPGDSGWLGGVNYFKNLFFALDKKEASNIEILIFLPPGCEENVVEAYLPYVDECHFVDFVDKKRFSGFLCKAELYFLGQGKLIEYYLKYFNIDLISHSYLGSLKNILTIGWIPDFQHMHLPGMFSKKEIKNRNSRYLKLIEGSDAVFLSSFDAKKDFECFSPKNKHKARVLQFVSQPENQYFTLDDSDWLALKYKYDLPSSYFYLPNQFWQHKNHLVAFQAIKILNDQGFDIRLVCTGNLSDYRSPAYVQSLLNYISHNKLESKIKLLGIVPYNDVFSLMKFSRAVINPSLFEGWSSTVEECKSVNKRLILSDIDVHKEQAPGAVFFQRTSPSSLALAIKGNLNTVEYFDLDKRTDIFAQSYFDVVSDFFLKK